MTLQLQSGVPPMFPLAWLLARLPVGPLNMSDGDPEDEDRLELSKGIQKMLFKCIAECSDRIHWAKLEALLPESKRKSSSNFRKS
jgi:hypothetical protein